MLENILKWLNNIAINSSTQASVFKIRCLRLRGTIEAYTNRFGRLRRCITQCPVCPPSSSSIKISHAVKLTKNAKAIPSDWLIFHNLPKA